MGYGDGSFIEQSKGHWVGFKTIDGTRYKRTGPNKTAVKAKFAELAKQHGNGGPTAKSSTLTVAQVVDEWLARDLAGRDLAPSTVVRHRWAANLIKKHIGKRTASALTVRQVDEMLDTLSDGGLSRASLVQVNSTLGQALKYAVRRGDLSRNVADLSTITPSAARRAPRTSLTPDQARALLEQLRHERNGLMFALSLRLGLRPGEAAALYWSDIADGAVNVTRGVQLTRGRATVIDELKTSSSKRTIELPADLVPWVDEHRKTQLTERLAATKWIDDRLVFASPTGNVLSPPNVRRQLADICNRITAERLEDDPGAPAFPVVKPNELRHSCASLLSDIGVPNESIADLLGHTTTRMVDQTYRHRLRPVVSVAAEADWTTAKSS